MPDISMCPGTFGPDKAVCPKRDTCYRYIAKANEFWQSYFENGPGEIDLDEFVCQSYWPVADIANDETYD